MKVVFFGASSYVIPIIENLNKNFELKLVITTEALISDPVPSFAKLNAIPFISIKKFDKETIEAIKKQNSPLAVLGYFGLILPPEILNLFAKGILNTHPSLLPEYRGPTPVQTALINGETKTGMTIIKLDKQVDHGPILAQRDEKILPEDTTDSLHQRLFKLGANMISEVIQELENKGEVEEIEQNHKNATFTKPLSKEDGFFELSAFPNEQDFELKIRAFFPWPGVWTKTNLSENGAEKIIKFLPFKKIQVEGKKEVNYKDFLNGYPKANSHLRLFLEKN